ncbi:hypothetical protein GF343_01120 [Candidatus Woesearchaeota archaeon]|nr:hypothetical protein [Candidatus Woesearchaeota archaeon]
MAGVSVDLEELTEFLVFAKTRTYGGEGKKVIQPDGAKHFEPVTSGIWRYEDEYKRGKSRFGGRADVFHDDELIWHMFYHGGMTPEFKNNPELTKRTFAFLKKVLLHSGDANSLLRGPATFRDGDFEYFNNTVEGDIAYYKGEEEIWLKNDQVYVLRFIGGLIE